ncbi:hypothetical protein FRX31_006067 [Thalictrum thalictroides]|uniref:Uncharacterized protein n=1 Tax=Thalictrum thalictroides TaxID=46969 RepID=A0A7J6X3K9_THATH|nr:hypothetical protein FRX31_006067 [Thalictrum thalictroides]
MDRNDFDLTGVEIDLTQFDGVFLDNDEVVDLAAMPIDEGITRDIDTSHAEPSISLTGEDSSRKRKAPETEPHVQPLQPDVPIMAEKEDNIEPSSLSTSKDQTSVADASHKGISLDPQRQPDV